MYLGRRCELPKPEWETSRGCSGQVAHELDDACDNRPCQGIVAATDPTSDKVGMLASCLLSRWSFQCLVYDSIDNLITVVVGADWWIHRLVCNHTLKRIQRRPELRVHLFPWDKLISRTRYGWCLAAQLYWNAAPEVLGLAISSFLSGRIRSWFKVVRTRGAGTNVHADHIRTQFSQCRWLFIVAQVFVITSNNLL